MWLYCLLYLQLNSLVLSLKLLHQIALCNGEILFVVFTTAGYLEKPGVTLLCPLHK